MDCRSQETGFNDYLLGVSSVVGSHPTVDQRNRRADRVGEVIPDQQPNLVAVVVRQESQKTRSKNSWQQLENDVEASLRPSSCRVGRHEHRYDRDCA